MAVRIAKGIASSKTSGSTLTIPNVLLNAGSALVVALGYDDALGHPTSVKWGQRSLKAKPALTRDPAAYDIAMSVWHFGSARDTETKDIVATWSGNIVERAMIATALEGVSRVDDVTGNNDAVSTLAPVTGLTGVLATNTDFVLCYFVSEGPEANDTVVSATILDGGVATTANIGQRAGTNGAPPVSNVTIQETWLQLTSAQATQGSLVASSERLWVSGVMTWQEVFDYTRYFSRAKCLVCGVVMWCTDELSPVTCACGQSNLNPDGTGTNITTVTDEEHAVPARLELGLPPFSPMILIEE